MNPNFRLSRLIFGDADGCESLPPQSPVLVPANNSTIRVFQVMVQFALPEPVDPRSTNCASTHKIGCRSLRSQKVGRIKLRDRIDVVMTCCGVWASVLFGRVAMCWVL